MHITVRTLSFAYDSTPVLSNVSFSVERGERWSIIGRNGAGKSTLIRCIAGLEQTNSGSILINGRDIRSLHPRELGRLMAYVPQAQGRIIPYSVSDYVMMGRFPYQGFFAIPSNEDHEIADAAMELTDVSYLRERLMTTLSGGELQRVFLAGAVSQQTEILLLDEPATFLDPLHQSLLEKALKRIHDEFKVTMIIVTHDINAAISNSDNILSLVDKGCVFHAGKASDVAERPELLQEIFGVPFEQGSLLTSGRRFVAPAIAGTSA
jgi:iron complex transport system ATP-binding protein